MSYNKGKGEGEKVFSYEVYKLVISKSGVRGSYS